MMQSLNASDKILNTKIKIQRERKNKQEFYTGSSCNSGVV